MARIIKKVKFAPCGACSTEIPRDDMHSMNVKVYDPEDTREVKIPIRLCSVCRKEWVGTLKNLEWDNGSMVTREVEVTEAA